MIQTLQWDSDFFALQIGRVDVQSTEELANLYHEVRQKSHDLIYIFSQQPLSPLKENINLVDIKTVYAKDLSIVSDVSSEVSVYTEASPSEELYHLALVSGIHSRYKLDKQLPEGSYERLYRRWIEQSTNGNMADKIFIHQSSGHIDGMVTIRIQDDVANIGLIAVDENTHGKGIGTKLIKALEHFLITQTDVKCLKVATQWDNVGARHFYEKCGFMIESKTHIYHWWL